jgi:hypothetical protein
MANHTSESEESSFSPFSSLLQKNLSAAAAAFGAFEKHTLPITLTVLASFHICFLYKSINRFLKTKLNNNNNKKKINK